MATSIKKSPGDQTMKTYSAKSSVIRAIKKAGEKVEDYTIAQDEDGKWYGEKVTKIAPRSTAKPNKSAIENPCRFVWEKAEEMHKVEGIRRKDVLEACVEAGVAYYTARTQYQQWRSATKAQEVK
jgi:hypothetical protein